MITEIAELLALAGLRFTAREIEDILWLASRIDTPNAEARPALPVQASPEQEIDNHDAGASNTSMLEEQPAPSTAPAAPHPAAPPLPLHAEGIEGSISGSILQVRGPRQTPAAEVLRRALQPFTRRIPSRRQMRLDEEATVTRIADSGMRLPVFRPVRERRFDLTLVIEDCTSAELREDTLRELSRHFRNHSGLRDVRCYRLLGESSPRLVALDSEAEYGPEHLNSQSADDGRHLVLFATDGTSPRWRSGSAQAFLHAVGATTSISLLHLLPRAAWRRTLIGEPDMTLHCERPGAANTRLRVRLPWWVDADEIEGALPVPVLGLDASSAGAWARAVSAFGGASMPGVLVNRPRVPITPTVPLAQASSDPALVVARYRNMASEAAYQLAVYLSKANPVTIPIMRLVQRAMLPDSGEGELAEFLLGGLVTRARGHNKEAELLYYFRDGVPDELVKALRYSKEEELDRQLRAVGRALESQDGGPRNFKVKFPTPSGKSVLSEWSLPFATVSRQILRDITQPDAATAEAAAAATAPAASAARTRLRVLHLSDMHFGVRADAELVGADVLFDIPWKAHLAYISQESKIDLVCVSGDLTWSASPEEFAQAGRFLDATMAALGLPKNRLFVVPGNHDMRWDPNSLRSDSLRLPDGGEVFAHGELTGSEAAAVARAQSNYREWLEGYLPHQAAAIGARETDFELTLPGWAVPVRILGLDSVWLNSISMGVALSASQVRMLDAHPRDGFTIVLMHHLPEQLRAPRDMQRRLQRAGVDLFLHGSSPGAEQAISGSGGTGLVSSGATLSPHAENPIACNVIDFTLDSEQGSILGQITVNDWQGHRHVWRAMPVSRWDQLRKPSRAYQPAADLGLQDIFINRGAELQRLQEIFRHSDIRKKHAARCVITGVVGAGKTTLFQHFARQHWPDGAGKHDGYVVMNARADLHLEDTLFKTYGLSNMKPLAERLRRNNTLLVVDDVDSPALMETALRLGNRLPDVPMLLIGSYPTFVGLDSRRWEVIELAPLSPEEAGRLLRLLLQTTNLTIEESDAWSLVTALNGVPALVRLVARHLTDSQSVARLLRWLGIGEKSVLPHEQVQDALGDFPWLLGPLSAVFEQRWRAQFPNESLDLLAVLGYGPVSGFSSSLGLAIAGFARRTASAAEIRQFEDLCWGAEASGFLRQEGGTWRFAAPAILAWIRTQAPKQRELGMRRWTDWLAIRLAAPRKERVRSWSEVTELPGALREWLATSPPAFADRVRAVCVAYAKAHGPLDAWQDFCIRILDIYPADNPARADWYYTLAVLAEANNEQKLALDAIDRFLMLTQLKAGGEQEYSISAAMSLKKRLETGSVGRSKLPEVPRRTASTDVSERSINLLQHQQVLADAAFKATLQARPKACIGRIVQALGTGMTVTLAAYLDMCRNSSPRDSLRFLVVADRIDIVTQLLDLIVTYKAGFEVTEPATVHELEHLLRMAPQLIVVTTEQKLKLIQGKFVGNWVIVAFGLRHPSPNLADPFVAGKMIVFGDESLALMRSPADELGPVIASYRREDAIRDGYFDTPIIRGVHIESTSNNRSVSDRRRGRFDTEATIRKVAAFIRKDWGAPNSIPHRKAILILDTEKDTLRFAQSLSSEFASVKTSVMMLNGGMPFRHEILTDFAESTDNALLVTTAGMAAGLSLSGLRTCYVAARITPAVQLKIDSFVNRMKSGKAGEIVDFVDNEWDILRMPTSI